MVAAAGDTRGVREKGEWLTQKQKNSSLLGVCMHFRHRSSNRPSVMTPFHRGHSCKFVRLVSLDSTYVAQD